MSGGGGPNLRANKRAAVLVGLFEDPRDGALNVLLSTRGAELRSHSGETAAPGGKRDPSDVNDVHTALRETYEEIGLPPSRVHVVSTMPSILSKNMLSVRPVVGRIPTPAFMRLPSALSDAQIRNGTSEEGGTAATAAGDGGGSFGMFWRTPARDALAVHYPSATEAAARGVPEYRVLNPCDEAQRALCSRAALATAAGQFVPRLSAGEVESVFAVPLAKFVTAEQYAYADTLWLDDAFRIHRFLHVTDRYCTLAQCQALERDRNAPLPSNNPPREFMIWGMTAYILIAAAALVYRRAPPFVFAVRSRGADDAPIATPAAAAEPLKHVKIVPVAQASGTSAAAAHARGADTAAARFPTKKRLIQPAAQSSDTKTAASSASAKPVASAPPPPPAAATAAATKPMSHSAMAAAAAAALSAQLAPFCDDPENELLALFATDAETRMTSGGVLRVTNAELANLLPPPVSAAMKQHSQIRSKL